MRSMRPFYSRLLLLSSVAASSALNAAAIDPQLDLLTEQMRLLDKAEQHIHLGGAWPLSYLKEVATAEEFAALTAMIDQISESVDYHAVFRAFGLTSKIMNSDERIENGVAALCEELVRDNVYRLPVELRTGLKNLGSGFEGYLQAVLRGMEKGVAGSSLKAGLVLSLRRDTSPSDCRKTIDLALAYFGKVWLASMSPATPLWEMSQLFFLPCSTPRARGCRSPCISGSRTKNLPSCKC